MSRSPSESMFACAAIVPVIGEARQHRMIKTRNSINPVWSTERTSSDVTGGFLFAVEFLPAAARAAACAAAASAAAAVAAADEEAGEDPGEDGGEFVVDVVWSVVVDPNGVSWPPPHAQQCSGARKVSVW